MENTIAANLSAYRAPATGVVLWVAPIAAEVSVGDRLITVVQPDLLEVEFRDYSSSWKQLKEGDTLSAMVQVATATSRKRAAPTTTQFRPGSTSLPVTQRTSLTGRKSRSIATTVRLRSITKPTAAGAPAILRAVVFNPTQPGTIERQLQTGLPIACAVTRPGTQLALTIPTAAIQSEANGESFVAVLNPVASLAEGSPAGGASPELYRIEWREVKLGKGDGTVREVESGLLPGDRISLRPADLHAITRAQGPDATVRLETT